MCLSADDVNPLCDACFAKEKAGLVKKNGDLCNECRQMLTRYCACCMTLYNSREEGGFEGELCRYCREGKTASHGTPGIHSRGE